MMMNDATTTDDAAADLIPTDIEDWTRVACELRSMHSCVESAVNLAWMLTKHTCQLMAAPLDEVRLERQIREENVRSALWSDRC